MTDHCFISYSNADALDFATKLADELQGRHPNIHVWFDKRELDASIVDWDDQLASAIRGCKCLLFVMTADSTAKGSTCKEEWTWALKYKKPVICLLKDKKAEVPFRLNNRQYIDISTDFDSGIAQLRTAIGRLDESKGLLDEFNRRLSDANRDLHRATDADKPRIKAEIIELTEQIKRQEEIVRNPKAAEEKTEKNIQSGLERERQPEKPIAGKTSTRFINPPPGIAPNYFQDRLIETKQIVDFLNNDSQRLMTIVGRAGVGKTAMVCRLLKALERGELPDDLGEMKADGIIYLSETGSHRVNFANVFADLSKLLPASGETAERLEGIYKNPQTSTGDKMRALLDAFPSGRVILLLDNFETLIDPESLSLRDSELSDALNALLGGQHHAVKAVITTRIAPRDLAISEPGRQHHLSLDEGLESPYAENVLREMDADGRVGLKSAPDALLNKAREKTRGYPRALEALYAILSVDRYTTLEELLELSLPDEVVQKLVGEAFNRLDPSAQKVMQALAVYNRPVSPAAIDYLLQPHLPSIDSALVLNRLVNMHFARREAGRYYLHPADKEYAFSIIPEKDLTTKDTKVTKENQEESSRLDAFTRHDLTSRAADYFRQARKPRTEWKKLDDLSAQLAEFELRCEARDYDTAGFLMYEIDFDYLLLWGHYRFSLNLIQKVQKHIASDSLRRVITGNLGINYFYMGQYQQAIAYHSEALKMAEKEGTKEGQAVWTNWIANTYLYIAQVHEAIALYEKSLGFARELGNRQNEDIALNNLGESYRYLGDVYKATELYEQALAIARAIDDYRIESTLLNNLGNIYVILNDVGKSVNFYKQSIVINRNIGHRRGETNDYSKIGIVLLIQENYQEAIRNFLQAIQDADDISYPEIQFEARWGLAQVHLFQNDLVNARATIEAALAYDVPQNNHNATALHGIIALRQGESEIAQEAFTKSIAQADEILAKTPDYYSALDAKGLALCGLILAGRGDPSMPAGANAGKIVPPDKAIVNDGWVAPTINDTIETFRAARKIAPHAGVVKSVLRLFDELVKCDEEGILKNVREVIEGK